MEQITLTHGGERTQIQSVLLLSDGLANEGITSKGGILSEMKKMQDQNTPAQAVGEIAVAQPFPCAHTQN